MSLGFESGVPKILREMNKPYGPDAIRRSAELLDETGLETMGFLMLGGPGETVETACQSLEFAATIVIADHGKKNVGLIRGGHRRSGIHIGGTDTANSGPDAGRECRAPIR